MDFSRTAIVELAVIIADHLQNLGIDVVLVGGLAVEIYTDNLYLTKDIDMVNTNYQSAARMHAAMAELGFRKQGRVYVNDTTAISVEFPAGPLSVGDEHITNTVYKQVAGGRIPILCVEDIVKDRLAAFMHWQDQQSLIQAVAVMLKHQLAPAQFRRFCEKEGSKQQYQLLSDLHKHADDKQIADMAGLEVLLVQLRINAL